MKTVNLNNRWEFRNLTSSDELDSVLGEITCEVNVISCFVLFVNIIAKQCTLMKLFFVSDFN